MSNTMIEDAAFCSYLTRLIFRTFCRYLCGDVQHSFECTVAFVKLHNDTCSLIQHRCLLSVEFGRFYGWTSYDSEVRYVVPNTGMCLDIK